MEEILTLIRAELKIFLKINEYKLDLIVQFIRAIIFAQTVKLSRIASFFLDLVLLKPSKPLNIGVSRDSLLVLSLTQKLLHS